MGLALWVSQIIYWFGFVFGFWFYNDRDSYTGKCLNFESKTKRTSGFFCRISTEKVSSYNSWLLKTLADKASKKSFYNLSLYRVDSY